MLEKYEAVYSLRIAEVSHYLLCEGFTYPIHHKTPYRIQYLQSIKGNSGLLKKKKIAYLAKECV